MKYPCRTVDTQEHDYLGVFSRRKIGTGYMAFKNQIIII
jgi:hypothetical protein